MVGLFQGCVVLYLGLKNNYPTAEHHSHGIVKAFLTSLPILVMPMFLVGSVVAGVATATESAGLGVLYALFVGAFSWGNKPMRIAESLGQRCLYQCQYSSDYCLFAALCMGSCLRASA